MDSPHQRIRNKIEELNAEIGALTALDPESTPRTIAKRRDLCNYLDDSIEALTKKIEQGCPQTEQDEPSRKERRQGKETGDENGLDKRCSEIIEAFDEAPFSARKFKTTLLEHPGSGTNAEIEDRAFRRIIRGWKDEEVAWTAMLQPLVKERANWDVFCERGMTSEGIEDVGNQLIAIHRLLVSQEKDSYGRVWVATVMQLVEIIKFSKIWKKHDHGTGSRQWKKQYLEAACRDENPRLYEQLENAVGAHKAEVKKRVDDKYKQFKRHHQHVMKMRDPLVMMYDRFGAGVFMDRVWDPRDQRHSGDYADLVERVCGEKKSDAAAKSAESAVSLEQALKVLATEQVVTCVTAFLRAYPSHD
ncbi:uncharacterized protein EV420DRAFT_1643984 [Desarmillaria tabescens]|uniref:Uncharacterized protein n=1 Tax=Armillaria tabescens TaxID=1929756 RepID=A0AA39K9U0_ARMTA|nr:uncharacterized protein EV420DRAFT_1643984 [Desarmillaria tabescens]KAK0457236.1 hypothetical protein EV420DRAFT_1643984 [Desarmillaria tabescens]